MVLLLCLALFRALLLLVLRLLVCLLLTRLGVDASTRLPRCLSTTGFSSCLCSLCAGGSVANEPCQHLRNLWMQEEKEIRQSLCKQLKNLAHQITPGGGLGWLLEKDLRK